MATGLVALLDDIAGIARLAAASLDDVGAAAGRASVKAAGVVVDDTAVTPRYVTGFTPERELPIIGRIALGSLRNKLLLLLPAALLLSALAPWAVTPLLMAGGLFLCLEGAEKVGEALGVAHHHAAADEAEMGDPRALEAAKVKGAIRTDLILSAEIMAIALAAVADEGLLTRGVALAAVGLVITAGVYGVVALLVKLDDIGLHLARRGGTIARGLGRLLVRAMPAAMRALGVVGTAAMLWVGGGILLHGAAALGWATPADLVHRLARAAGNAPRPLGGTIGWAMQALAAALLALAVGGTAAAVRARLR